MKLIFLVIFILFLAFTALSTAADDENQEDYYVFQAGETYVYDAVIRRWKLLVPLKN